MKRITICLAFCLALGHAFGQKKVNALQIGDQMPEHTFANVINYHNAKLSLKDFKGKYVILDFWERHCSQCISLFPHMQELQHHFDKDIQIVLVNSYENDNREVIEEVFKQLKRRTGTDIKLPTVYLDKKFYNTGYFPHKSIPHEVIINPEGKVFAITSAEELSKDNIRKMIDGELTSFPIKNDYLDLNLPLLSNFNLASNDLIHYSALLRHLPLNGEGNKLNNKGEKIGRYILNSTLWYLYKTAYLDASKYGDIIGLVETRDPLLNPVPGDPSFDISYDFMVKVGNYSYESFVRTLRQDLDRTFGFTAKIEMRNLPCLIIKTNAAIAKSESKYKASEGESNLFDKRQSRTPLYAHHQGITIIGGLNLEKLFNSQHTFFETDYDKMIDIDFPVNFDFNNPALMKSFLHERGIELSVENRDVKCFVISDKPKQDTKLIN